MLNFKTPAELTELLAPFVGVRLAHKRDDNGHIIPRSQFVDIAYPGARRIDADIREISEKGISSYFLSGCRLIAWSDISEIVIRNEAGGQVTYRVAGDFEVAA